jgi:hypothetical protein
MKKFVPCTPAGTPCVWIAAKTEEEAIQNLLNDASHMLYNGWKDFQERGYTIEEWDFPDDTDFSRG